MQTVQANYLIADLVREELDNLGFIPKITNKTVANRLANKIFASLNVYPVTVGSYHREYMEVFNEVCRQIKGRRQRRISLDDVMAMLQ